MKEQIVIKCYKNVGLYSAVLGIEPINSFKFKVSMAGGIVHIAYVYKSRKSMKEPYDTMNEVDGYYVFLKLRS